MVISVGQCLMTFVAIFASSYLLTSLVDFKAAGKAVHLNKFWSAVFFSFYKGEEVNVFAVCLQAGNYLFTIVYLIVWALNLIKHISYWIQVLWLVSIIVITVIAMLICNKVFVKNNKEDMNK